MATLDFKQTHSWQDAVELGAALVVIAESLPPHEQTGLVMQLHQLMLDLPSQVAIDLGDSTKTRFVTVYRLASALELIEKIYPALDTAHVRSDFEQLVSRLESDSFSEIVAVESSTLVAVVNSAESHDKLPVAVPIVAEEPEYEKETGFPVSPSIPQVVAPSPTGIPLLGVSSSRGMSPDLTDLPEGVAMSEPAQATESQVNVTFPPQAADVQPNSL